MQSILIAGGTSYLGRFLVAETLKRNFEVRVIDRDLRNVHELGLDRTQAIYADLTHPESLKGVFDGIDIIVSTLGISCQNEDQSEISGDFGANLNVLREAKDKGISKFVFVSTFRGTELSGSKNEQSYQRFLNELKSSGIEYVIIRPTGLFCEMRGFLKKAKTGKIFLYGSGEIKHNPIHCEDLAEFVVDSFSESNKEIHVGGPDILTLNEIAQLALGAVTQPPKIIYLPSMILRTLITTVRFLNSYGLSGVSDFAPTMLVGDKIAPRFGIHRLKTYFNEEADLIERNINNLRNHHESL